jgi:uncharacterized membrane protein YphA (DoxX/SURF4 family)
MDTPCTAILLAGEMYMYTLHIHAAGSGKGYALHVHSAGCGNGYTLHFHRQLLMVLFLLLLLKNSM